MPQLTYRSYNLIISCILFCLVYSRLYVEGATHVVGDNNGWMLFNNSSNWTQGKEFHVDDVLVFNYERDVHNVMQVNSTAYADCTKDLYMKLLTSGNDSVVLSESGSVWFICGVNNHCQNGQKLSINVVT